MIRKLCIGLLAASALIGVAAAQDPRSTYTPRPAAERAWGGLQPAELLALHRELLGVAKVKVQIFCGGDFCRALAEDFDEAFESAGHDATLETSVYDVGKGLGLSPDTPESRQIAAAIKKITGGRVDIPIFKTTPTTPPILNLAIGRKPVK